MNQFLNDDQRLILAAYQRLEPFERSVINLCDVEGIQGQEAAQRLGVTPATISIARQKAHTELESFIRATRLVEAAKNNK